MIPLISSRFITMGNPPVHLIIEELQYTLRAVDTSYSLHSVSHNIHEDEEFARYCKEIDKIRKIILGKQEGCFIVKTEEDAETYGMLVLILIEYTIIMGDTHNQIDIDSVMSMVIHIMKEVDESGESFFYRFIMSTANLLPIHQAFSMANSLLYMTNQRTLVTCSIPINTTIQ